jgi:hypothetical protein
MTENPFCSCVTPISFGTLEYAPSNSLQRLVGTLADLLVDLPLLLLALGRAVLALHALGAREQVLALGSMLDATSTAFIGLVELVAEFLYNEGCA